ncbi:MAG: hypothetical protein R2710_23485 [Acidimicrobiales bacterium]
MTTVSSDRLQLGTEILVQLDAVDTEARTVTFTPVGKERHDRHLDRTALPPSSSLEANPTSAASAATRRHGVADRHMADERPGRRRRRRSPHLARKRGFGPDPEAATADNLALVVIHRGRLVTEAYGPNTASDDTLISWSMGKSITQALVGLLTLDGLIDVDQPADVARWADDDRRIITTWDLLWMTSASESVEDYVDDQISHVIEMLFGAGARRRRRLRRIASAPPRPRHHVQLLERYDQHHRCPVRAPDRRDTWSARRVLRRRCRARLPGPARLLRPIGMSSAIPKFDDAGTFIGSSFVYATAQDFARFGYLYLRDGVGRRTAVPRGLGRCGPHSGRPACRRRTLVRRTLVAVARRRRLACQGYEGQRIVVVLERDLVTFDSARPTPAGARTSTPG